MTSRLLPRPPDRRVKTPFDKRPRLLGPRGGVGLGSVLEMISGLIKCRVVGYPPLIFVSSSCLLATPIFS